MGREGVGAERLLGLGLECEVDPPVIRDEQHTFNKKREGQKLCASYSALHRGVLERVPVLRHGRQHDHPVSPEPAVGVLERMPVAGHGGEHHLAIPTQTVARVLQRLAVLSHRFQRDGLVVRETIGRKRQGPTRASTRQQHELPVAARLLIRVPSQCGNIR